MEYLNYLLAVVICFISIYIGFFLALIAKEELKAGNKYLLVFQKALFAIVVVSTIFVIDNIYISLILLGILIYFMFIGHQIRDIFIYLVFGVLLYLNSRYGNLFLMQSALVFLYGLPAGSLLAFNMIKSKKKRIAKHIFTRYIWFVVVALVLFMVF